MPDAGNKAAASAVDTTVTLAGRTLRLRFSILAMSALQKELNLASLDAVMKRLGDAAQLSIDDIVAFFWAGLRTHHPEIDIAEAARLLDAAGLGGMQYILGSAFTAALPPAAETADDDGESGVRPTRPSRSPSTGS